MTLKDSERQTDSETEREKKTEEKRKLTGVAGVRPAATPNNILSIQPHQLLPSSLTLTLECTLLLVQCSFTSTENTGIIRDGEPRTATSTFTQLLCSEILQFSVALRPQRPQGLLGTGSPGRPSRLSHKVPELWNTTVQCCFTSTETVRTVRDREPRTATWTFTQLQCSEILQFTVALRPQRPQGLLGTGSPGRPSRLSQSP